MDEWTCEGASVWKETLATINRKPQKGNAYVKWKYEVPHQLWKRVLFFSSKNTEETDLK